MEVQWVYSTKLKDERFIIDSVVVLEKARIIQFVVDTGAKFTCCNYAIFDENLLEKNLIGNEVKFIGGFVKGKPVKFYKCSLKQFTIGNISMDRQSIWITFDERVTDTVLGMDILKQITFIADSYKEMIYFCKDYDEYRKNGEMLSV